MWMATLNPKPQENTLKNAKRQQPAENQKNTNTEM